MSGYHGQAYNMSGGGSAPPANPNSFRKGLGFVPNTITRSYMDPIARLLKEAPSITRGQFSTVREENILYKSEATIPLFTLEQIAESTGEERSRIVQSLAIALMRIGFVGIKADQIMHLMEGADEEMRKYFNLPFETKLLDWSPQEAPGGYCFLGKDSAPKAARPDFKESYLVLPHQDTWPQGLPGFSATMRNYHAYLTEYAKAVMKVILEFLGEDKNEADTTIGQADNILRLTHYPAIKPDVEPNALWAAPCLDRNVLSLTTPGSIPGLQYYSLENFWKPIVVPKDYLIVSVGSLLRYKTAGLFRPRWHRVVNPNGKWTRMERYAASFHAAWPEYFSLKPYQSCLKIATKGMSEAKQKKFYAKYKDIPVYEKLRSGV